MDKARVSYCQGRSLIELSPGQRTRLILVHEAVHALGPETHGARFQNLYADMALRFVI
jgi:hypothetical protein